MAEDEACGNPFGLTCTSDLEESNEESSFGEELLNSLQMRHPGLKGYLFVN